VLISASEGSLSVKRMLEQVEQIKIRIDAARVTSEEGRYLCHAALLSSSRDCDPPGSVGAQRLTELNQILAAVQRVGLAITQESFYKDSSEEFEAEIQRRDAG